MTVRFEFYGVAALKAGRDALSVTGSTLGEALAALEAACPPLAGMPDKTSAAETSSVVRTGRPSTPSVSGNRTVRQ